jgi:hypothetical protein
LRRAIHRAAAIALLKKSIFNLRVDPMEPPLGTLGSLLISGDLLIMPNTARAKALCLSATT